MEISTESTSFGFPFIENPIVINSPDFSLSNYISRYEGVTKLNRLQFIAKNCISHQEEAYRILIISLLDASSVNTKIYVQLKPICELLGPGFEYDSNWVDNTDAVATEHSDRLESEFRNAKSKAINESIRLSLCDLGDFNLRRGM